MSERTTRASARPTAAVYAQGSKAWRNALFVIFASCGVPMASIAARIPSISNALSLTTGEVGLLLAGIAVGSVVGLLAAGHLVAIFGSRRTILVAFVTAALALTVASFGIAVLGSFPLSFAGLIVFGSGFATTDVAMNVSGAANERAIGRSIMPIFHAFFSFGTIIGAGAAALAERLHVPLELHMSIVTAVVIVAVLIALRYLRPEAPDTHDADGVEHPKTTFASRLAIWKEPRTILIGLIVLGMAFTEGSSNDWLSYAMVHGHGTDHATGAVVYSVFVAAMTVGRFSGVKLLDTFGRVPVLRGTAILAAVGLLLFIFVDVFWIDVVGAVFWGIGASLGFPVGMSAAADDPQKAAARVSAVATIGYVAFLVGPPLIGFLGNEFGILHGLLLVLGLAALAGLVSFAAREPKPMPVGGDAAKAT
jgi:MFS family permease